MAEDEQAWREALRRRLDAGQTISGLPTPHWPEAPINARSLPAGPRLPTIAPQRPLGPLRDHVGPRIDLAKLQAGSAGELDEDVESTLPQVNAWPLLPLIGASFEVDSVAGIAAAIRGLLAARLPGPDWWVPEHWDGPFCKYGMLHESLPAPPNTATGEPMALEVFGMAERVISPGSDEWAQLAMARMLRGDADPAELMAVRLPTRVVIEVATYANVRYPGVGVPLYM